MNIVAIYNNGGKTLDETTVVVDIVRTTIHGKKLWDCLCIDKHGYGFSQWSECIRGRHLGKKISLSDLTIEAQQHIINRINEN